MSAIENISWDEKMGILVVVMCFNETSLFEYDIQFFEGAFTLTKIISKLKI